MEFEWDAAKSELCFIERGFDFAYALRAFLDPDRVIKKDTRRDYGEDRYQLLGIIEQRVYFITYTPRGTAIRIISVRRASKREVQEYEISTGAD